jgi:hypothetical protein
MAWTEPIKLPTEDSDEISTSSGMPSSRSTTASIVSAEASGYVPAAVLDGGKSDLRIDGGERGGLDCFGKYFSGVLPANARDLCVIVLAYRVLCVNCTSTADNQCV